MTARKPSRCARAFTLIEIVLVILVLVIAAAIVVPNIGTASDTQAVGAARVLRADLEAARSLALMSQQPHTLLFSTDRQSYKVVRNYAGTAYASTAAVTHPILVNKAYEVRLAGQSGMGGVTVVSATFGGLGYVTFSSLGDPSSSGTVVLRSGRTEMRVIVETLTGIVTVTRTAG